MAQQQEGNNTYVSTVVRDDFFNDPFFKNWWADFDKPMATWDKGFNRQVSGKTHLRKIQTGLSCSKKSPLFSFAVH